MVGRQMVAQRLVPTKTAERTSTYQWLIVLLSAEDRLRGLWRVAGRLRLGGRPTLSVEACVLLACVLFASAYNMPFWRALLRHREPLDPSTWLLTVCVFAAMALLHFGILSMFCIRWTVKPVLAVLIVVSSVAVPFMQNYGVYLDASMVRNIVRTDLGEAQEYLSRALVAQTALYAVAPLALLFLVKVEPRTLGKTLVIRPLLALAALLAGGVTLLPVLQQFVPLMRTERQMRYLITPGNYLYSLWRLGSESIKAAPQARQHALARDRHTDTAASQDHKPVLFVMVVGETARADNFALNGYPRDTNPRLTQLDVINFTDVKSCGTSTEVSLPCMFSSFGRADYDKQEAAGQDGLLHVLSHAGYSIEWKDNNSGCKGTCEGDEIAFDPTTPQDPDLCKSGRCLDEVLLRALRHRPEVSPRNTLVVLHQLGNHGPAYHQRYPAAFRKFTPTCDTSELRNCTATQITNTYDNAILYTDYILAEVIQWLRSQSATYHTAMLYVGDHGESLGEGGLYLHGVPYAIAPHVQTHVPMLTWMSDGFKEHFQIDTTCLRQRSSSPASHDNVFHSVLGILSIESAGYRPDLDVSAACRSR